MRDWELGKNYAAEIALRADVKHTLVDLNVELAKQGGAALVKRAAETIDALQSNICNMLGQNVFWDF